MKKRIIIFVVFIIIALIIFFAADYITKKRKFELYKERDIKITFVKEIYMDITKPLSNSYRSDFSWCYQVIDNSGFEGLQERFGLESMDLDYESGYYIISLGRELQRLFYQKANTFPGKGKDRFSFIPIFEMDNYEEHIAYVYKMEGKIDMLYPDLFCAAFWMFNIQKSSYYPIG